MLVFEMTKKKLKLKHFIYFVLNVDIHIITKRKQIPLLNYRVKL